MLRYFLRTLSFFFCTTGAAELFPRHLKKEPEIGPSIYNQWLNKNFYGPRYYLKFNKFLANWGLEFNDLVKKTKKKKAWGMGSSGVGQGVVG